MGLIQLLEFIINNHSLMSIYQKTKEEICDYLEQNFTIGEETIKLIIEQYIDGEVLFEFKEEDFDILKLFPYVKNYLKEEINLEKNNRNQNEEQTKEKIIQKIRSFGIIEPFQYFGLDFDMKDLKIGQAKILKKYEKYFEVKTIDVNSSGTEVLNYLKNTINISKDSLNALLGIKGSSLFNMNDKRIDNLKICSDDKNKLKNFLKNKNIEFTDNILAIDNKNDLNEIETKSKLEDMIIIITDGEKITMKHLYEKLKEELELILAKNKYKTISDSNPYKLKLNDKCFININNIDIRHFFDFSIGNQIFKNILLKPIKAKIKADNDLVEVDIISIKQIDYIIREKKFNKACGLCQKCKLENSLYFFLLFNHAKCGNLLLYDSIKFLEFKNQFEFKRFFPNKNIIEFESPDKFEINFKEYFNRKNLIRMDKKFIYYSDIENRDDIKLFFQSDQYFGKHLVFFGFPGTGKSISLIHILKYEIDLNKTQTFYVHCKYLSLLTTENNYIEIQRILLSEIPYLFHNDYQSYCHCCKMIKEFEFRINNTFIELIGNILQYAAKINKKMVIIFDQHNYFSDPDNKIKKNIIDKILLDNQNSYKFLFLSFMSLNNKDAREYKINHLLGSKKKNCYEIYKIYNLKCNKLFQSDKKQRLYEKIGKTIKNFNELIDVEENKLSEYYKNKKADIKSKLIEFYNGNNKKDDLELEGIEKLMKISVNVPYEINEFEKILKFVHFKYFDIKKENNYFEIFYLSDIIEEAIKEMYYSFVYNNQYIYEKLLTKDLIKGGGRGCCFEQIVISKLSPNSTNNNDTIPDLLINEEISIPQFIPKSNEIKCPYFENKININNNTTYLVNQTIFGGKEIDFIIIDSFRNFQNIYAFQASILKNPIFSQEQIENILNTMYKYLGNFISGLNSDKKNLYFGYIFSTINEDKALFKSMINKCNENHIQYSYYSVKEKKFLNYKMLPIRSINEMAKNPFNDHQIFISNKIFQNKFSNKNKKISRYKISMITKNKLIKILEKELNLEIENIIFKGTINTKSIGLVKCDLFYSEDNYDDKFVLIRIKDKEKKNKYVFQTLKGVELSLDYLFNRDFIFDCYSIVFIKNKYYY